jgi:L-asparaginase
VSGRRPTVVLLSTGGTITSVGRDRLDLASYIENGVHLGPGELLSSVPEAGTVAEVREIPYLSGPSHGLRHEDWVRLVATLEEILAAPDIDGVVLTHGTNTLEETAYFLSLVLRTAKPVVLTGAMRPSSGIVADGPLNLLEAIRVAAAPQSRNRGVLVVMAEEIFAPRDVTKMSTYRLDAFRSPDGGPIGHADIDGSVRYRHSASQPGEGLPTFDLGGGLPRVDVVASYVGADGVLIDAAVGAGARGIVSAGTGAGRPTPAELEALTRARDAGVVVCQTSRVGSGVVVASPGLQAKGFVAAGNLGPWKARLLLALALTVSDDPARVQLIFDAA